MSELEQPEDGGNAVGGREEGQERGTNLPLFYGLIVFALVSMIATIPIMTHLATTKDPYTAFALLLTGLILLSPYSAVSAIFKAELFPTEIRAMAVGISFATAVSIFGGTSELIALSFKQAGHEPWYYWYMTGAFFLALIAALIMPRPAT